MGGATDLDRVVRAVLDDGGLAAGARVVVGASGGPDSAGLLLVVAAARPDLDLIAVHVRHGLRDDQPDADAARAQADAVGARFVEVAVDVRPDGDGPEAAARRVRHAALQRAAAEHGAVAVLLGHTRDDQAETVLLRLARGTTLHGAAGMATWRAEAGGLPVGRPLLSLRREDVHKLVAEAGVVVVHDPTNDDPGFTRNVVRGEVLPALGRHGADPAAALARFADRAREDARLLDDLAADVVARHAVPDGDGWAIDPAEVHDAPAALARRVVAELLRRVRPGIGVVADEVDDVLALRVDRRVERRGVVVVRHGRRLRFAAADTRGPAPPH